MNRHHYHTSRTWLVVVVFLMLVCGCLENSSKIAEGGIEGTGKSVGPISGFGSVYVNGIRLDTTDALFVFEGQPGSQSQLFQGMVINATSDAPGSADLIEFHFNLVGALVDTDNKGCKEGNLTSLEQLIVTDVLTVLRNTDLNDLKCGDVVAVSGFHNTGGHIVATYLEKLDASSAMFDTIILEGIVDTLNEHALTFRIGNQLVNYAAAQLNGFADGGIANGLNVRVVGREDAGGLAATSIQNQMELDTDSTIEAVDISGLVTAVGSGGFILGNTAINLSPGTVIKNGTLSDIVVNARFLARASRDKAGTFVADEIIFPKQSDVLLEAVVEAVNPAQGTVTLAGLTTVVNSFTLLLDRSSTQQIDFSLDYINIGDRLIIFGFEQGERTILASRLERVSHGSTGNSAIIEGHVGPSIDDPVFFIAGLLIDTTDLQDPVEFYRGRGSLAQVSRAEFFGSVQSGDRLRVLGLPQSGSLSATEVSLLVFGNFTMLDGTGTTFGGTNDIVFTWDGTCYNSVADADAGPSNMTMGSDSGFKFFGFPWFAHDIKVYCPGGPYVIDTCNDATVPADKCGPASMTVPPGHLGGHILLDWNTRADIDVLNVWNNSTGGTWENVVPAGQIYQGPAGPTPALDQAYQWISTDADGDGIPGITMKDGPFIDFRWNLNLNEASPPPP